MIGNDGLIRTVRVLGEALEERMRQDDKWGQQNHPWALGAEEDGFESNIAIWFNDQHREMTVDHAKHMVDDFSKRGILTYADILMEEVVEALGETDPARAREELIQVIAVAVAAVESLDRNGR